MTEQEKMEQQFQLYFAAFNKACERIKELEEVMQKLVQPFEESKPLFGAQHLRSVRVGDQVVEELLAAMRRAT